jgi:catechol 2,3-dioxygenase-like lactoylglutathione lyase family enzyme
MDEELLAEEISHYEALLRVQRRNLRVLELQAARHGPFDVPLPIQTALGELRVELVRIERKLEALRRQHDRARGMFVADHPPVEAQITFFATGDLTATAHFYGDVVGLELVLDRANCRIYQVAAAAQLGFYQAAGAAPPPDWPIIAIVAGDVDVWHAYMAGRGAHVEGEPRIDDQSGVYHFFARDPNGYRIEVRRKDEM